MKRVPIATYRVQLRPEFGFADATALADYWAALGISHLYTSPCLKAVAGSTHGYDVVDPGRVNDELGGAKAHAGLSSALSEHGMEWLLDIVPNHMSVRGDNAWWLDVLENGPSSRYATYFDVEWRAANAERVLLPILGDQYGVELESGRIRIIRHEERFFATYYEHQVPLAPRSLGPILREVAGQRVSDELAFLADSFSELPLPNAPDRESRKRRHRDKGVLTRALARLLREGPEIGAELDAVLGRINADPERLHETLERQNYRLAFWRMANYELEYRRFFDIDSLVGLRVEDDEVFEATHWLVLDWMKRGLVHGLRIDHVDGLYDPEAYLRRLRAEAPEAWLLVEKILEGEETLPSSWPVDGTTGYEFLNAAQRVLLDLDGERILSEAYRRAAATQTSFEEVVIACKQEMLTLALDSDVKRLLSRLAALSANHVRYRDFSHVEWEQALRELIVAFPVYRSYVRAEEAEITDRDRHVIARAAATACERRPDLDARLFDFLKGLLLLHWRSEAELEFVARFQQVTGPAMAKGVEDTAFYRYQRLLALNEVGGDPGVFALDTDDFHAFLSARQNREAFALNTTSTHDTKRSEDVRARLLVLAEIPARYHEAVSRWARRLDEKTPEDEPTANGGRSDGEVPHPLPGDVDQLLFQNLIGAWPIEEERMAQYLEKALREGKVHSSWRSPNPAFEHAVKRRLSSIYTDDALRAEVADFVDSIRDAGYRNSLSQLAIKLFAPGVPDVYQGTELWDFSLVDPDNRRPVDYAARRALLREAEQRSAEELWEKRSDGGVKLHVLRAGLALRARHADAVGRAGGYAPLNAEGERADRVVGFARGGELAVVFTRLWQRFGANFGDTELALPPGEFRNAFTGSGPFRGRAAISDLLGPLPVAALERIGGGAT